MNFDFPAFLVFATFLTGVIWLIDALFFAPKRRVAAAEGEGSTKVKEPLLVEYSRSFFPIILIVLILRSFLVEPFRIPSGSMMPTLLVGDFILVNKFAYGIRLPVLNRKVVELAVMDTGSGMDNETLKSVFDPFFTTKENGTGLGLSTCHNIVEMYRGRILVESRMGRGSKFTVQLPAAERAGEVS